MRCDECRDDGTSSAVWVFHAPLHAQPPRLAVKVACGVLREGAVVRREQDIACVHHAYPQQLHHRARKELAIAHVLRPQVVQLCRELHARWTGSHDHKGEQRRRLGRREAGQGGALQALLVYRRGRGRGEGGE